jgi:putative pyoverdin transport system ATP-binding/permease protein
MNLLTFLLQSSWRMMALAIITGLLSGITNTLIIAIINHLLNHPATAPLLWSFLALVITMLTTRIISQIVLIRLVQTAIVQLRLRLSQQILASELAHLEQVGAAKLLAMLTDDIQAIANVVGIVPFFCIDLAMAAGGLIYILWLDWRVLVLVCLMLATFLSGYRWLLHRAKHQFALAREQQDQLFTHFRAITDGTKELKLSAARRYSLLQQDLQPSSLAYRRHSIQGDTLFALIDNFGQFAFMFAFGVMLFALPRFITISPAALSGYVLTFIYLSKPLENLIRRLPFLSRSAVALNKITTLGLGLADRAEATHEPQALTPNHDWQQLELKAVTHQYGSDADTPFTLGPLSLSFHPGEVVFIVGGNGSGKSTLAKLITGLYSPEGGQISLDDRVIGDADRIWYRQHFSTVFADFYLFNRLLGPESETVESARPAIPDLTAFDAQAQAYLRHLQLDHKVTITNGQLSTTALSQGQRKRLALLSAYLEDRPIYLFDEWAADQDPLFKALFYTEILGQLRDRGKTVLVISHDDYYFGVADRIIKLDYGQIEYDQQQEKR